MGQPRGTIVLKAASGEPAGRRLRPLVFDIAEHLSAGVDEHGRLRVGVRPTDGLVRVRGTVRGRGRGRVKGQG